MSLDVCLIEISSLFLHFLIFFKGTRLKEREAEIRNKQIEANRELRLFEIKSNELGAQWRADQRSLYKVIKELSEIDENLLDIKTNISMLKVYEENEEMQKQPLLVPSF
jgi:hypothetical protein